MAPNPVPVHIVLMMRFVTLVHLRMSGDNVSNEDIGEVLRLLQEQNALSPVVVFLLHAFDYGVKYDDFNQSLEEEKKSKPINTGENFKAFKDFFDQYDRLLDCFRILMRGVVCGLGHTPTDDKEVKDRAKLIIEEKSEGHQELVILMMGYEKVQEVYTKVYEREKEIFM
jgi:hypothetical protein